MRKGMKQWITILTAMLSLFLVSGCGAKPPAVDMNDTNMTQVSEMETDSNENMTQVSETETPDTDQTDTKWMSESQNGAGIQENENYVYFFGTHCIYVVDKTSDNTRFCGKAMRLSQAIRCLTERVFCWGERYIFWSALKATGRTMAHTLRCMSFPG